MDTDEITELINKAVKNATDSLRDEFQKANTAMKVEMEALKVENTELKSRITNMERAAEKMNSTTEKHLSFLGEVGFLFHQLIGWRLPWRPGLLQRGL